MKSAITAIFIGLLLAGPSVAQDRYQLEKVQDGTVRLDRKTGEVSFCRMIGSGIVCTMAADERGVLLRANQELEQRVEILERRLAALEAKTTADDHDASQPAPGDDSQQQPMVDQNIDDGELDRAMRVTESVMRRFIGMMKDLSNEFDSN